MVTGYRLKTPDCSVLHSTLSTVVYIILNLFELFNIFQIFFQKYLNRAQASDGRCQLTETALWSINFNFSFRTTFDVQETFSRLILQGYCCRFA